MIPQPAIVEWGRRVPWPTQEQVEQDLLLSRLIVEIAGDEYLRDELAFRGGTCLHKLFTGTTHRYSEDLDYVRRTTGGIADLTRALTAIGERLDMKVNTQISRQPKVYFRVPFESGTGVMRIKVEMNTFERSPVRPLVQVNHAVDSSWFAGSADVTTFSSPSWSAPRFERCSNAARPRPVRSVACRHAPGCGPRGARGVFRAISPYWLHRSACRTEPARQAGRSGVP